MIMIRSKSRAKKRKIKKFGESQLICWVLVEGKMRYNKIEVKMAVVYVYLLCVSKITR